MITRARGVAPPAPPAYRAPGQYYEEPPRGRSVWPWLIGPFIDAWFRVYPQDHLAARAMLQAFNDHLNEAGVGSVSDTALR